MIKNMDNAQVKHLVRLMNKAKYRRESGFYLIEGPRMACEVPPEMLHAVYFSENFSRMHPQQFETVFQTARLAGAGCEILSEAVFSKVSDTVTPQGVICVVRQRTDTLPSLLAGERPLLLLILEGIQDPGNLGTMLRTGEAAGVSGVIVDANTVDRYNPKVVRGTMGAVFRVPFVTVPDLISCIGTLQEAGVKTAAMSLQTKNDFYDADFTGDTAFLIGNEGSGLSAALQEASDLKIRIPMEGKAESLNAAVASSICMYEAMRQRHRKQYLDL